MDTENRNKYVSVSISSIAARTGFFVFLGLFISACGGNSVAFTPSPLPVIFPTATFVSTLPVIFTPTPTCISGLTYVNDVTIPDYSVVAPGISLDKQWLVQNSGTCNWDSRYRLRLINGDGLGASPEQALYPARAGMQIILRMIFVAPLQAGEYVSEWQAFDAQGIPFGKTVFMKIIVQ
jgi:hypothetical protein